MAALITDEVEVTVLGERQSLMLLNRLRFQFPIFVPIQTFLLWSR